MTSFYIRLYVKFRAFGITFGNIDKTWRVTLDPPSAREAYIPYPDFAHVIFNERGVKLSAWKDS